MSSDDIEADRPPPETPDSHEAFPCLSADQLDVLQSWGQRRPIAVGDVLYHPGQRVGEVLVVLSGRVGIVESDPDDDRTIQVHGQGGILGELGMLEGQPAIFGARAVQAGEILAVPVGRLSDVALQDSVLGETILRAFLIRRSRLIERGAGMRIIGSGHVPDTRRLLEFSARNRLPHKWIDLEKDSRVDAFLRRMNVDPQETPVVILGRGKLLRNPSNSAVAAELGMFASPGPAAVCDLLVVGAGPAGLAASVYGASDGLSVTAVDAVAVGGQASTTSRIENYLGFPAGISGAELTERAFVQATRFGAQLLVPATVTALAFHDGYFRADLGGDHVVHARTVVVASGARYRRLDVPGLDRFETANVYYEATVNERQACGVEPVAVIGGGNSAGQAAVFLADTARRVYLLVRDSDLGAKMSRYLADQISRDHRITVMTHTEVRELRGDDVLTSIVVEDNENGSRTELAVRTLFVFIGAQPQSAWLAGEVALDTHGFVLTGSDLDSGEDRMDRARHPSILQTSQPGIFAAGDVRRGATRRVAAAMGEGAIAVASVNQYLADVGHAVRHP
ncbi:FAD-dependent oxidoreductase [Mycobacterium terramassiliense]|uniref:Thioredoxin reductase n=1 Tax=Mycobacterium terramassiliense TaxID=1841859 RepID=A0A2U3NB18_9MYCO|nr:FAD-dependent oxidoreductase [Mycobacterium terramassiliense]SPM28728.1 Thioredoxin reductase [Mycobacterium terramassiliense]